MTHFFRFLSHITLAVMLTATCALAQKDSTKISATTETGMLEKQTFLDEYNTVFHQREPQRFMLKWNAAGLLPIAQQLFTGINDSKLQATFEAKISQHFSLNAMGAVTFSSENVHVGNIAWGVEPRYYLQQNYRDHEGHRISNLSGTYLGASFQQTKTIIDINPEFEPSKYTTESYALVFGIQHRFLKHGYVDLGWRLGANKLSQYEIASWSNFGRTGKWHEFLDQRLHFGWELGGRSPKYGENKTCDVFKCFREETRLVKIDLVNLISELTFNNQRGSIGLAYEQKWGQSAFSTQIETNLTASNAQYRYKNLQNIWERKLDNVLAIEPRWYFTLNRRIAKGKSGNNLNGLFLGLNAAYSATWSTNRGVEGDWIYTKNAVSIAPVVGFQYRIFNHGFVEYHIGAGPSRFNNAINFKNPTPASPPSFKEKGKEIYLLSELKVGVAF